MSTSPKSSTEGRTWPFRATALGLLAVSMLALLAAPSQMPEGYSWLRHTTSESAAQGVPGAWLARLGFLVFGLTIAWISLRPRGTWATPVRAMHAAFGLLLVATAAFSTRAWSPEFPFDPTEDALHSFTATAMGFAFALGVVLRFLRRGRDLAGRAVDLIAAVAAVAIPLGMSNLPEWDGLLQRGMFAIAYGWYGFEVLRAREA